MGVVVSDLEIAGMLMAFLIGLAIAAPIWGYDSRDGIESDQASRRIAWLHGRRTAQTGRSTSVLVASALRTVAHRLDSQVVGAIQPDPPLAEAC